MTKKKILFGLGAVACANVAFAMFTLPFNILTVSIWLWGVAGAIVLGVQAVQ